MIRVLNEEHALRRLLECLSVQKLDHPFEVVVIDNESNDGSANAARERGARVYTLPRPLFGYGRAINAGVRLCRGEMIVLLSAHSWPQGDDWLQCMVDCVERGDVAAAYCRQISDSGACRQEKPRSSLFAEHDYKLDSESLVRRCRSGEDVYEVCCFSNAAAAFRREAVLRFPFRDLPYAEDRAFVLDCVLAGCSIAYLSTVSVVYRQPAGFRNFYRIGRAAAVSSRLIREFGSEAVGTGSRETGPARKVVRLLGRPPAMIGRIIAALLGDLSRPGRVVRYAAMTFSMCLGSMVGELTWHRYRKTASWNSAELLMAEKSIRTVAS